MLIAQKRFLKSSVVVLDSEMNQKLLPLLDGVKITQAAMHEGHLFALDEKNVLLAINLKLLCNGISPSKIVDFSKHGGGSVISIDEHTIWAFHSSGEMHRLQTFAGSL